jgi:hypothetical protein
LSEVQREAAKSTGDGEAVACAAAGLRLAAGETG